MNGVVVFNPDEFRAEYPKITASDMALEGYFSMAETFVNNTPCSLISDLKRRKYLLYLLVAHMAILVSRAENGNDVVGRISSATEGSVAVSLDYGTMGANERWYLQTTYGALYWQLTKPFRSIAYRLGRATMPVQRVYVK